MGGHPGTNAIFRRPGGDGDGAPRRSRAGEAAERVWLIEHPPLYTAGTSAKQSDLVDARFPVHGAGRGGQFTYHGPGQRVAYVMLDLKRRRPDVRAYVASLERWLIEALQAFDVVGETARNPCGRVGRAAGQTAVRRSDENGPKARLPRSGVRVRRWVTFHGISLNVDPDLSHFSGIVPCGIAEAHLGRHQSRRSRPPRHHGASGCGPSLGFRDRVRPNPIQLARAARAVCPPSEPKL